MVEFTKSMLSFSWAQALFGAQQLMNMLTPRGPGRLVGKATAAFNSVARTTGDQFGGILKGAYHVGDMLQRGTVDLTFNFLTRDAFHSEEVLLRQSTDLLRQALDVLRFLASGQDLRLAWQEFRDKMQVFQWVRNVDTLLQLPTDGSYVPLTELVDRAYALGPFPALWVVEGAGHYYADSLWGQEDPRDLLTDARAAAAPEKSMTMLHAGIGLAFAERLLQNVTLTTQGPEIREILRRFLGLCRANSRPGYVGAALESLGLVTRDFHPPSLAAVIDEQLAPLDEEALAYFWHGVGRAIYFSPTYFLPFGRSPWRAVELCHSEAPHELGRLNAIAGLAWAMTLVNMLQPHILEVVVKRHGAEFAQSGAFANGIFSSIIMRYDMTPDAPFITAFCQHQPDGSDPSLVQLWNNLVQRPCEAALQQYHGLLKENNRLGEIFRFQPWAVF
jgi:hypothetical protein